MKLKLLSLMVGALSALSLSGCTIALWSMNPASKTTYNYQDAGIDKVYAFGQTQKDSSQLKAGSLVMMGEKYWYALDKNAAQQLLPVLNAKLARQYQIKDHYHNDVEGLPVDIQHKEQRFTSDFCLHYTTHNAKEIAILQDLSFKQWDKQPATYTKCFVNLGKVFAKPVSAKADYRFEQSVPVVLRVRTESKDVNVINLLNNIVMTPFAVAGDLVILPLVGIGTLIHK